MTEVCFVSAAAVAGLYACAPLDVENDITSGASSHPAE